MILLTGSAGPTLANRAKALGAERTVRKPTDWDRLAEWAATPLAGP